jgi:hypothetical protein
LTIIQWVQVRGDFCWYWWNCWPSLNELMWDVILVDIGGIVDNHSMSWGENINSLSDGQQFHQYQQKSPLTWTHWMMVNNSTNINKHYLSLQLIEWWSTILPISTQITSHFNSFSDGRWFLLILVELLIITQWVEVRCDFGWYWWNCWPSLNEFRWEVIVNNSTNINKNHLSHQLIEWWSTSPPISTKITSHLNSLSDGQQFNQYQQTSPVISTHWMMDVIFVDIGGIVDHHLMYWGERWF